MKTSILTLFVISSVFLSACSEHDEPETDYDIKACHIKYLITLRGDILGNPQSTNIISFEYSSRKLIKRTGLTCLIPLTTGYYCIFMDGISEEIIYQDNKIILRKDTTIFKDKTIESYTVDNNGRIIKKQIEHDNRIYTTDFYYSNNLLIRSESKRPDSIVTALQTFHYNLKNNLDSITVYGDLDGFSFKKIMRFSDYDNAPNPFKELGIFDDFFYRSLSTNNFRKYSVENKSTDESQIVYTRQWQFQYDQNGYPIVDR